MDNCKTCAVPKIYNHNVLKAVFSLQKGKSVPIPVNNIIQQVIAQMRRKRMLETVISNTLKSLSSLTQLGILDRSASSKYGFHRSTDISKIMKRKSAVSCRSANTKKNRLPAKPKQRKAPKRSLIPTSDSEFSNEADSATSGSLILGECDNADALAKNVVHKMDIELQNDQNSEENLLMEMGQENDLILNDMDPENDLILNDMGVEPTTQAEIAVLEEEIDDLFAEPTYQPVYFENGQNL